MMTSTSHFNVKLTVFSSLCQSVTKALQISILIVLFDLLFPISANYCTSRLFFLVGEGDLIQQFLIFP